VDVIICVLSGAFLHARGRKPLANGAQAGSAPTELAIGTDTGFQPDKPKYEIQTATSIVLMPNKQVRLPRPKTRGESLHRQ
jgi:hypothetical protein